MEEPQVSLSEYPEIERHLFTEKAGVFYFGGERVPDDLRKALRDEAKTFQTTRLYRILDDKITAEAARMALLESTNWEHTLSGKQLYNWNRVMKNIVYKLSRD